ncbi:MAG TPA: DUF4124 domain-containing protein [Spongiibacteraceae bacterium]|nr:DUF4124 domain-containing protein [Spongiibacteraceae bacterium]
MRRALWYSALSIALVAAGGAVAQTVYKSVDEKGNVIYSESPPTKTKNGAIRSTKELSIDPNQNVLPVPPSVAYPATQQRGGAADQEPSRDEKIAEARAALEAAEAQLKAGSEAQAGDFLGRAGGGVGPSPQRLQRLQELQQAVDQARENLQKLEGE